MILFLFDYGIDYDVRSARRASPLVGMRNEHAPYVKTGKLTKVTSNILK